MLCPLPGGVRALLGRSDRQTRAAPLGSLPRDEGQNGLQTEALTPGKQT